VLEHAAKMQRIEIDWIGAQDGVVDLPRLVQAPMPMQGKRLLDETRCGGGWRGCLPFHGDTRSPSRDSAGRLQASQPIWLIKGKNKPQELHVNRIGVSN
jgi:hypothetical protein